MLLSQRVSADRNVAFLQKNRVKKARSRMTEILLNLPYSIRIREVREVKYNAMLRVCRDIAQDDSE